MLVSFSKRLSNIGKCYQPDTDKGDNGRNCCFVKLDALLDDRRYSGSDQYQNNADTKNYIIQPFGYSMDTINDY